MRAQVCGARARVGDDPEDDPVQLDLAPRVVELRLVEDDPVAGRPARELERPGAHGTRCEPRPERIERLRRHDHPRAVCELGQERREARVEPQPNRVVVHHLDGRDRRDLAGPGRSGQRPVPVERGLDRRCIQRRSVVEADTAADLDRHRLLVARKAWQRGCELRNDLEPRVQVVQLLAHVQEDHAPDEGPRERRIERVRIFCKADRERPAGLRLGCHRATGSGGEQASRHECEHGESGPRPTGANPVHESPS